MKMCFKYIMINRAIAVLFNHGVEHIDEANGRNVTSAGFCKIWSDDTGLRVECYGLSTSLNIDSNPARDALIIKKVAMAASEMGL